MESVLLTLALATCLEAQIVTPGDNTASCTIEDGVEGKKTLITACGLAPEKSGRPITIEVKVEGEEYIVVLEPKCVNT